MQSPERANNGKRRTDNGEHNSNNNNNNNKEKGKSFKIDVMIPTTDRHFNEKDVRILLSGGRV